MALSIEDPEIDLMVRQLSELTGETIAEAVKIAVRDRLAREQRRCDRGAGDRVQAIVRAYQSKPVVSSRAPDDVVYGQDGLPR